MTTDLLKVFGWSAGNDGCAYYRMTLPLMTLDKAGMISAGIDTRMPPEAKAFADIIVAQRLMRPECVDLARQLQGEGKKIVIEHDDDLTNIRDDNPAITHADSNWPANWTQTWRPAMHEALGFADLVTCTNEYLATQLRQYSDNVAVLPNYTDAALLDVDAPTREPWEALRVGWGGSPTHDKDWAATTSDIAHGLRKINADLVMIGADYRELLRYNRNRVIYRSWEQDIGKYFQNLTDIHVGLAPLADDHFNRSKSYVKALEYASLGIPCIASDVGPYRDFVQHGVTGFLASKPGDWTKYLRLLNSDEDLRRQMGAAARKLASRNTIQGHSHEWLNAYEKVMACPRLSTVPESASDV